MGSSQQQPSSTSTGCLRTKISLKGNLPQTSQVNPFYGISNELPRIRSFFVWRFNFILEPSTIFSGTDLISYSNLNGFYNRYCIQKKMKDDLASFLPQICGASHLNAKFKLEWSNLAYYDVYSLIF
jgi:hypothetical protein